MGNCRSLLHLAIGGELYQVNRTRQFNLTAVVMVGAVFITASTAVPRVVNFFTEEESKTGKDESALHTEMLPGISYILAEVECRQWRRNRAARPFNFALRQ